jgi:hypothetical protein
MSSAATPHEGDDRSAFRLFAILSGIAAFVLLGERDYELVTNRGLIPMPLIVPIVLAGATVLFPGKVWLFLAHWAASTYFFLLGFPWNNTNQTLRFFVGLAVLASAAFCMARRRTAGISDVELFRVMSPVLRVCAVTLYFWTIWHKLNFDFLNPDTSCGRRLMFGLLNKVGLAGNPDLIAMPGVVMTVLVETALPVGLFFARTQRATALLGLGFHWMLGTLGFSGFSATMFSLLVLFLAPLPAQAFSGYAARVAVNRGVFAGFLALLALGWAGVGGGEMEEVLWYAVPAIAAGMYWLNRAPVTGGPQVDPVWRTLRHPNVTLLVPLLMFVNGASPFLGFKTEYSFAMYSNLRTEGGRTNHVLWRMPLSVFGYQKDLVELLPGTDERLYAEFGGRLIPRYQLTTAVYKRAKEGRGEALRVVVRDRGIERDYPNASKSELNRKPRFFERTLLSFRKIVPPEKGKCAH